MRNERAWPQQCWKSCANGSNIVALRFGDHGTKEMLGVVGWKVWPVSNFAQQHATTSNNMQQGLQTDAACNIQQCWELQANMLRPFAPGLTFRRCCLVPVNCSESSKILTLWGINKVEFSKKTLSVYCQQQKRNSLLYSHCRDQCFFVQSAPWFPW